MTFTQYYIAFGVPAALLTFATLVFWAGLPTYRIVRPTSLFLSLSLLIAG
jgi:hypothetical protein